MKPEPIVCIIDTNIVVAGLLTTNINSPTARILDRMLDGKILFLMSENLLREYASVLRRPKIVHRHTLSDEQIDILLTELVSNAIWLEPDEIRNAPDPGDNHLWSLLASHDASILVTGDHLLADHPPQGHTVLSAGDFVNTHFADDN